MFYKLDQLYKVHNKTVATKMADCSHMTFQAQSHQIWIVCNSTFNTYFHFIYFKNKIPNLKFRPVDLNN
jgi:hypothetical protein